MDATTCLYGFRLNLFPHSPSTIFTVPGQENAPVLRSWSTDCTQQSKWSCQYGFSINNHINTTSRGSLSFCIRQVPRSNRARLPVILTGAFSWFFSVPPGTNQERTAILNRHLSSSSVFRKSFTLTTNCPFTRSG